MQNGRIRELFEPPAVKVWADVASVYARIPLEGSQHQPRFVLPIDLITGVASEGEGGTKEFVAVWRLVRTYWLSEVLMSRRPPEFATRRAWKSFAAGVFSGSIVQTHHAISTTRARFAEFMWFGKILSLPREDFTFFKGDVPGTIDKKVTTEMVRDTVIELTDLNFFFDMFEVEYLWTYDSPGEIVDQMQPAMGPFSLAIPKEKIPQSRLIDLAGWLIRVRDFIRPWDGKKSKDFDLEFSAGPTIDKVDALEKAVAEVYCSNVTYILRRRPVLPRYE